MYLSQVKTFSNRSLEVTADDGRVGVFDITPYLKYQAFELLSDFDEFQKVSNRGYFVEWACGADLSADTIEAHMRPKSVDQKVGLEQTFE